MVIKNRLIWLSQLKPFLTDSYQGSISQSKT